MIKTPLCELLGIEYPIFQGGMAWISDASLAVAVSQAGGLGIISAINTDTERVRTEIRKAKALTAKPFGVNIMLMNQSAAEIAEMVIEEKVPVVTTGAGTPARYMSAWLEAGIKIIPVVASVATAKMAARSGACAVIAEGGESGGHVGDLTTMTLVPQVCDAVNLPVIAAGGVADGRGIAAALMLGAVGVQLGTRFLLAEECTVHENYKEKVLKARDIDTMTTGKRLGHPVRALKNQFMQEFFKQEYNNSISNEELEKAGAGALCLAAQEGDPQRGCFMAGQVAGMIHKKQPAAEMIREMLEEAQMILGGAGKWLK